MVTAIVIADRYKRRAYSGTLLYVSTPATAIAIVAAIRAATADGGSWLAKRKFKSTVRGSVGCWLDLPSFLNYWDSNCKLTTNKTFVRWWCALHILKQKNSIHKKLASLKFIKITPTHLLPSGALSPPPFAGQFACQRVVREGSVGKVSFSLYLAVC